MVSRIFVWLGGALFVAALALCAWWYLAAAGADGPFDGTAAIVDTALLSIFALHHSVFAREPVKAWLTRVVPTALQRSVYVWIASVLLIVVCVSWRRIGGTAYDVHGSRAVVHAAVQLFGIGLIARSVAGIDPLELAGIRDQAVQSQLQTSGPYGWVRHPLYLGWVMAVFGAAHQTGDRLAFAAITTIYLMVAVPWEERSLVNSFGDEYRSYQQRVRWRIVPYLY